MLPCLAIASTVTMKGRSMIEETKNYVEAHFPGAVVRYGDTDSVMVEFDCQGRTGVEAIEYSWQLGEQASDQCSKLFKHPNDLELEKVLQRFFILSARGAHTQPRRSIVRTFCTRRSDMRPRCGLRASLERCRWRRLISR